MNVMRRMLAVALSLAALGTAMPAATAAERPGAVSSIAPSAPTECQA